MSFSRAWGTVGGGLKPDIHLLLASLGNHLGRLLPPSHRKVCSIYFGSNQPNSVLNSVIDCFPWKLGSPVVLDQAWILAASSKLEVKWLHPTVVGLREGGAGLWAVEFEHWRLFIMVSNEVEANTLWEWCGQTILLSCSKAGSLCLLLFVFTISI